MCVANIILVHIQKGRSICTWSMTLWSNLISVCSSPSQTCLRTLDKKKQFNKFHFGLGTFQQPTTKVAMVADVVPHIQDANSCIL